jgi:hypothetical protein
MASPIAITCQGIPFSSIKALAEHYGLPKEKVVKRLASGWTPEQAVGLAPKQRDGSSGRPLVFEGVRFASLAHAARAIGLDPGTVANRVAKGYSSEDALRGNLKGRTARAAQAIEFGGRVYTSRTELAKQHGLVWRVVGQRIAHGWTMTQALGIDEAPPRFRNFEGHAREHKWKEVRVTAGKTEPVPDTDGYKLYLVTNTINDKVYVGLTIGDLGRRLKQHFAAARRGRKSAFANALRKYGEDAFKIELITSSARTYDELQVQEVEEIAKRDAIRNGYNTALGGSIGTSKAITIAGKTYQSFAGAAEAHGVDPVVFSLRVSRLKWTPEQAAGLDERKGSGRPIEIKVGDKVYDSLKQAAAAHRQSYKNVHSRLNVKGWTLEQALGVVPPPVRMHRSAKAIRVRGVDYKSIADASKHLGVSEHAMRRFIRLGATPDEAYTRCRPVGPDHCAGPA